MPEIFISSRPGPDRPPIGANERSSNHMVSKPKGKIKAGLGGAEGRREVCQSYRECAFGEIGQTGRFGATCQWNRGTPLNRLSGGKGASGFPHVSIFRPHSL